MLFSHLVGQSVGRSVGRSYLPSLCISLSTTAAAAAHNHCNSCFLILILGPREALLKEGFYFAPEGPDDHCGHG